MRHIKLFEQFLLEADLEKFYSTKIKNPKTGREATVKTILGDPDNPMHKKVKAKEDQLKGGSDDGGSDEMKEAQAELKQLQDDYSEKADELKDIRSEIADLKNDISDGDEDMAEMAKEQLEEKEEELEEAQADLDKIKSDIDEVKDFIKSNK